MRQVRVEHLPPNSLPGPYLHRRRKSAGFIERRGRDVAMIWPGVAAVGDEAAAGRARTPIDARRGRIFAHLALQQLEIRLVEHRPGDADAAGGAAAGLAVAQGLRHRRVRHPVADRAAQAAALVHGSFGTSGGGIR